VERDILSRSGAGIQRSELRWDSGLVRPRDWGRAVPVFRVHERKHRAGAWDGGEPAYRLVSPGVRDDRRVEGAHGGTLFLDEVGRSA
jgi:hypothetical protein